jgi:hypothetical protein
MNGSTDTPRVDELIQITSGTFEQNSKSFLDLTIRTRKSSTRKKEKNLVTLSI